MDTLTFSDLRRIQKDERKKEELTDLEDDFIVKANEYLQRKEENADRREYNSSKRVYNKIIALREEKVVENARMALKSNIKASELNLLPSEKELFRDTRKLFEDHRERLKQGINSSEDIQKEDKESSETKNSENNVQDDTEDEIIKNSEESGNETEKVEDGYSKVKIITTVPEFMGTDLESYGPFDEGDQPVIPNDNAEILLNRGNAEEI